MADAKRSWRSWQKDLHDGIGPSQPTITVDKNSITMTEPVLRPLRRMGVSGPMNFVADHAVAGKLPGDFPAARGISLVTDQAASAVDTSPVTEGPLPLREMARAAFTALERSMLRAQKAITENKPSDYNVGRLRELSRLTRTLHDQLEASTSDEEYRTVIKLTLSLNPELVALIRQAEGRFFPPPGLDLASNQRPNIAEPYQGAFEQWQEAMRTLRTFVLAHQQTGTLFAAAGDGPMLDFAWPFADFTITIEPGGPLGMPEGIVVHIADIYTEQEVCSLLASYPAKPYQPYGVPFRVLVGIEVPTGTRGEARVRVLGPPASAMNDAEFTKNIGMQTWWTVVRFLHALDHRRVQVIEIPDPAKPSRQQRRQAERAGEPPYVEHEHFKIYIPPTLTYAKIVADLSAGKNSRGAQRSPHDRRGHLRRDKYGRKRIWVRDSKIHGGALARREYQAQNVGMEGIHE